MSISPISKSRIIVTPFKPKIHEIPFNKNLLHCALDYFQDEETYLITSKGGGGHQSAADAIQSKIVKEAGNKKGVIHRVDILRDSIIPNFIADMATGTWDKAKREGDINKQISLVKGKFLGLISYRSLAEFLFFVPIFLKTFFTLWGNRKITRIIDTQPLGTSAVVAAARLVNFLFNRYVHIFKIMTDMPTEEAVHFADSAKCLSAADKKIYHLLSTHPFAKLDRETEENYIDRMDAWWKEHFNLSYKEGQVSYIDFPLRPAFIRAKNGCITQDIGIKLNSEEEKTLLIEAKIIKKVEEKKGKELDQKTGIFTDINYSFAPIPINARDMVALITIGSQANREATKAYIEDVIELVKRFNYLSTLVKESKNFHLFVACGRHEPLKPSLFREVTEMIKHKKEKGELPSNLNIVPMGYQSDEQIAPIMHRADFGIYGAGGLATMEALVASDPKRAHVFIHSDAKGVTKEMSLEEIHQELLNGYALWEKGNAEFHLDNSQYQAALVCPKEVFRKRLRGLIGIPEIEIPIDPEEGVG